MTIEEMLRSSQVQTAENGLVYAVVPEGGGRHHAANGNGEEAHLPDRVALEAIAKMVAAVPRSLVPRLGRSACYFVPWLYKQRRAVAIAVHPAAEGETRKEMCHHLDVKPQGNLLLISLHFYEHDSYGLAMEFFDKIAYLATIEADPRDDFNHLLRRQLTQEKPGELTPEAWEWRAGAVDDLDDSKVQAASSPGRDQMVSWQNYRRAAEADTLGLYMAALFTEIFYEDLFEPEPSFPPISPDAVYERLRAAERLYPPNRGFSLMIIRQRARRRKSASAF